MKIAQLSTHDIQGGAARAAYRLHKGLLSGGADSCMLVQTKMGDDTTVLGPISKFDKGLALLRPTLDQLPLNLYRSRKKSVFYPAWFPENNWKHIQHINPDIVHVHWICEGFVRIENIRKFQKPIVWTLHDSWPFTGGCHIPFNCLRYQNSCGKCPYLGSNKENDLSHRIWKRKNRSWKDVNLTVVTPSRWLSECAQRSSLFRNRRVEVIPNGINISIYKPFDKLFARDIWGLPRDKRLILFGAMSSTSDSNKGFHLLQPALLKMNYIDSSFNTELIVFGDSEPASPPDFGMKTHYMGRLHDDVSLALLYAAADVFIAPSIHENLSNVVLETLACGTPCVAFNIGGMPDMIEHKKNGYLARPFEPEDLAHGISWVLKEKERLKQLSRAAREKSEEEFSVELMAERYIELYEELLDFELGSS